MIGIAAMAALLSRNRSEDDERTLRDMMIGVAAMAALLAGVRSRMTGQELGEQLTTLREDIAEMRGELRVTTG